MSNLINTLWTKFVFVSKTYSGTIAQFDRFLFVIVSGLQVNLFSLMKGVSKTLSPIVFIFIIVFSRLVSGKKKYFMTINYVLV